MDTEELEESLAQVGDSDAAQLARTDSLAAQLEEAQTEATTLRATLEEKQVLEEKKTLAAQEAKKLKKNIFQKSNKF